MTSKPHVAVVGATGAVGQQVLKLLAERQFPVGELSALATSRSQGKRIEFGSQSLMVKGLCAEALQGVDLAFFCVSRDVSLQYVPECVRNGAVCIDKSTAYRLAEGVPLVVPEVNGHKISEHRGIIANPNCTTIPLTTVLAPLHRAAGLRRVAVSSFQSVSGTGRDAVSEFTDQARLYASRAQVGDAGAIEDQLPNMGLGWAGETTVYPQPIFGNALPHIDSFGDEGYTGEEWKLINETRKILNVPDLSVAATCVRIPVVIGHCLSVHVETETDLTPSDARDILRGSPGAQVCDDPDAGVYPTPLLAAGRDEVFVGRIRRDLSVERGLVMWVVVDNLRKGAATNAVQIAEALLGLRCDGRS